VRVTQSSSWAEELRDGGFCSAGTLETAVVGGGGGGGFVSGEICITVYYRDDLGATLTRKAHGGSETEL
jgi:hypothetical protein